MTINWEKAKPWLIGVAVVAVLYLIYTYIAGSSSDTTQQDQPPAVDTYPTGIGQQNGGSLIPPSDTLGTGSSLFGDLFNNPPYVPLGPIGAPAPPGPGPTPTPAPAPPVPQPSAGELATLTSAGYQYNVDTSTGAVYVTGKNTPTLTPSGGGTPITSDPFAKYPGLSAVPMAHNGSPPTTTNLNPGIGPMGPGKYGLN